MTISSQLSGDGAEMILRIDGRFDFSQHQAFRAALEAAGGARSFVVDLGHSEYMDSAALGMLLLLLEKAGGSRERVRIVNPNPNVRKILEIANFDKLFTLA
ncbi:anti-anti-sigma factor [Methylomagnum ishizawai]|uniref:Anti-anti-sigma factor n=1 Tax=Methylomagnum ishizawai TaxID=1760988 RepID=A0A1Y6CUN0_9GAMM|nr:STAS domain-containing protein [Methylomagnum ishizawai]SMF94121.1 anti-anti-sigma factor [Methylomagnum ishizawai]